MTQYVEIEVNFQVGRIQGVMSCDGQQALVAALEAIVQELRAQDGRIARIQYENGVIYTH